jgi:hypothetical protein
VLTPALAALSTPYRLADLLHQEVQHISAAVLDVMPFLQMKKRVRH